MGPYASMWILMGPYGALCVLVRPYGSYGVFVASIFVLMEFNGSFWVPI